MFYIDTNFKFVCISNRKHPDLVLVRPQQYEFIIRYNVQRFHVALEEILFRFIQNQSDKKFVCERLLCDDSFLNFTNINFNKIVNDKEGNSVSLAWYWVKHWGCDEFLDAFKKYKTEAKKIELDDPAPTTGENKSVSLRTLVQKSVGYDKLFSNGSIWLSVCDPQYHNNLFLYTTFNPINFYKVDLAYARFKNNEPIYGGLTIAWLLAENKFCDLLYNYYLNNPSKFIQLDFNVSPPKSDADTGKTLAWLLARDEHGAKILTSIKEKYPEVYGKINQSAFPISGYGKLTVADYLSKRGIFSTPNIPSDASEKRQLNRA